MLQALGLGNHVNVEYDDDDDGWDSGVYLVDRGRSRLQVPAIA